MVGQLKNSSDVERHFVMQWFIKLTEMKKKNKKTNIIKYKQKKNSFAIGNENKKKEQTKKNLFCVLFILSLFFLNKWSVKNNYLIENLVSIRRMACIKYESFDWFALDITTVNAKSFSLHSFARLSYLYQFSNHQLTCPIIFKSI